MCLRSLVPVVATGFLAAAGCGGGGSSSSPTVVSQEPAAPVVRKPNIVFIVTDDLDSGSIAYLPRIKSSLVDQGVSFSNSFASDPVCCPSRATMLTGQYPHNHGIWTNGRSISCFEDFRNKGQEANTIATWLKGAGYRTGLVGKYLNRYPGVDPRAPQDYVPPGWDSWYAVFNADETSDSYYSYYLNENRNVVSYGARDADYLTDVLTSKAVDFIQRSSGANAPPFFLWLATSAPHQPAVAASRYVHAVNARAPRPPSFNEADISDKPSWYQQNLPPLSADDILGVDDLFQRRVETMMAVEDGLDRIIQALQSTNQLANTYIVLTSDNGFTLGVHRFPAGKESPYEESIKVPLIVRGPGVPAGVTLEHFVSGIDLAATFAEWAGIGVPASVDGRSLAPVLSTSPTPLNAWRKDLLVEHEGTGLAGGLPSWSLIREKEWKFAEYGSKGELEYYDLANDPYELSNRGRSIASSRRTEALARLHELQSCAGSACRTQPSF